MLEVGNVLNFRVSLRRHELLQNIVLKFANLNIKALCN
jgi:hypothetical protein